MDTINRPQLEGPKLTSIEDRRKFSYPIDYPHGMLFYVSISVLGLPCHLATAYSDLAKEVNSGCSDCWTVAKQLYGDIRLV